MVSSKSYSLQQSKQEPSEEDNGNQEAADFETAMSHTGFGKYNYLLLCTCLCSNLATVFDTSTMSYLLPAAECDLNLTNFQKGVLNAMVYVGMVVSSFVWGFMSDILGRKYLLITGFVLDVVINIIGSFAQTFWFFTLCKFVAGLLISGPICIMMSFIAEFHGSTHRPRIMMCTGMFSCIGTIILPIFAWIIIPQPWTWVILDGKIKWNSWRILMAFNTFPAIMTALAVSFFKESPKFLLSRGRYKEALEVFQTIYAVNKGKHPSTYPIKSLKYNRIDDSTLTSSTDLSWKHPLRIIREGLQQMKPLFIKPYARYAALVFTLQGGALMGMNTLRLWLPQLFATIEEFLFLQSHSNNTDSNSLCDMIAFVSQQNETSAIRVNEGACSVAMVKNEVYVNSIIVGIAAFAACILGSFIINIVGKRNLSCSSFVLAGISTASLFWSRNQDLTLALSSVSVGISSAAVSSVMAICVDLFPTSLRAMAVSLAMMSGEICSFIGNFLFPVLLDLNCIMVFFLLAGISFGLAGVTFLLPNMSEKYQSS